MQPAVNYWKTALSILAALSASLALAEDFKTINGKEYKNVSVSRVEPDGIVLKSKSGIAKVYFTELPKNVQERFHHDSAQNAHITADERQRLHSKMQHWESILSAEPLINSLPDMGRHKIRQLWT